MNIQNVFSIAALILGCYIILSYFLDSPTPTPTPSKLRQQFHLGCFLTEHNLTHADHIELKLQQLKSLGQKKQSKGYSVGGLDYVEAKGLEAARNFQLFMADYVGYRGRAQVNVDLGKAVATANQDFRTCLYELNGKGDFSQKDCLSNWESYLKCKTDLNILKNSLNFELSEKNILLQKMKNLLNPTLDHRRVASPNPHDDLLKQLRHKQKQLTERETILESQQKLLTQKISESEYNYSIAHNNTVHARQLYLECSGHRKQFRQCQELSEEVLSLGHGSISSLEAKVERKRNALTKMQRLMNQNQGKEFSVELRRLYFQNLEDFQKLLKLFIQVKAKIKIHCGCTEAEQANLKQSYEKYLKEEQEREAQKNRYLEQYKRKSLLLQKIRSDKRQNFLQQQQKMKKLSNPSPKPSHPQPLQTLSQLQSLTSKHDQKILTLNTQFNDLQYQCDSIKNRISGKIGTISKINDCLNKYQYYVEIREKYEKEKPKEVKMGDGAKRKFLGSLKEFIF